MNQIYTLPEATSVNNAIVEVAENIGILTQNTDDINELAFLSKIQTGLMKLQFLIKEATKEQFR